MHEQPAYSDEHFKEVLRSLNLFDSARSAPTNPTGVAVAVRGDNVPWDCGEHLSLDRGELVPAKFAR